MNPSVNTLMQILFLGWGLALMGMTATVHFSHGFATRTIRRLAGVYAHSWVIMVLVLASLGSLSWIENPHRSVWVQVLGMGCFLLLLTPTLVHWLITDPKTSRASTDR